MQREVALEQSERVRDLESASRSGEARCAELKEAAAGHEARSNALSAEVQKANRIIEQLSVCVHGHLRSICHITLRSFGLESCRAFMSETTFRCACEYIIWSWVQQFQLPGDVDAVAMMG